MNITITAEDASNASVPSYSGAVHFTSSNSAAVLPAVSKLTNGVGTGRCGRGLGYAYGRINSSGVGLDIVTATFGPL